MFCTGMLQFSVCTICGSQWLCPALLSIWRSFLEHCDDERDEGFEMSVVTQRRSSGYEIIRDEEHQIRSSNIDALENNGLSVFK